jgi:CubicO group peptidase (beta-lactamase class C family)
MNKRPKVRSCIAAAAFGCLCLPDLACAQNGEPTDGVAASAAAEAAAAHPLTATDLNAWLDGYMPHALARGDIAGAAVIVVSDGEVMAERGWGLADVASGRIVDPDSTVFRIGSVGKLFTWTAVMQLVERGKLDLDADINAYLDFRIPPRDGRPITLRHLMTHTPGFEERIKGIATANARSVAALED